MRRDLDAYSTPFPAIKILLERESFEGTIYECCNGEGCISSVLRDSGLKVLTNDINKALKAHRHGDAAVGDTWNGLTVDWTITNPPFDKAIDILKLAYNHSRIGVAFMLRLSFLEPCNNRGEFLEKFPPSAIYVLPRISFTGDGKKDNVTSMWAVWDKRRAEQRIRVITKSEIKKLS